MNTRVLFFTLLLSLLTAGFSAAGAAVDSTATPGLSIPFERNVSPTGCVTYSVTIFTDPLSKFAPQISLIYSSQAGNGIAGYGWSISGLPSISLIPSTRHFQGDAEAPDVMASYHFYSLDGLVLEPSEEYSSGLTSYPLKTVRGNIRAKLAKIIGLIYIELSLIRLFECLEAQVI